MQLRTLYTVLEKKNTKSKGTSKKMKEDDTLNDERIMKVENINTRTHKPYALKGRSVLTNFFIAGFCVLLKKSVTSEIGSSDFGFVKLVNNLSI